MSDRIKPSKLFWTIAVLSLLWNLFGLMDYYNSVSLNADYLGAVPGALEYVQAMPAWAKGAWGLAITASVLGSVCLILRKKWAFPLFGVALVGMLVSFGYQMTASNKPEIPGAAYIMTIIIWIVAIALTWYAKKKSAAGILA